MTDFIPQMAPLVTAEDRQAVSRYLDSGGWLTEFEKTREFERQIAAYTGAGHCRAAPSGTMAIFLAASACGLGRGDEVVVPDLTMAATATAAVLAGAEVVFADIEPRTLCLDLADAERRFTPRTKAVIFVSLNGRSPAGLAAFVERCRARGIRVIEDAAQSLGSFSSGRHLGTLGDCGCLSFSSQKIVTTGQGGAVITGDPAIAERLHLLRDFGRLEGGSDEYLTIGWNFKFTDLQAVIGIEQMKRIRVITERKKAVFEAYRKRLSGVPGLQMPHTDLSSVTPWFVDILVAAPLRAPLVEHLRAKGIGSREIYPALHGTPAFSRSGSFPVAEDIARRGLWLPSSLALEERDIERVCGEIARFCERNTSDSTCPT